MVNCLTPFLSLPSLCFKWEGEGERMNPSAQNDPSDLSTADNTPENV